MSDGDLSLLTPDPENPYSLGRHLWHDPQNRDYPIRELLEAAPPRARPWWRRGVYDQGAQPSCTAQAAAGVLETSPNRLSLRPSLVSYDTYPERHDLYLEAQRHDPWPGEAYAGSSTDAPFKVLRNRGHIAEWRWCFGLHDVIDTLDQWGPVAIGVNWYRSMFYPDSDGYVKIEGERVGGHAIEILWWDHVRGAGRIPNSWGPRWGQNGRFWLLEGQLERLLGEDGEAVTVVL